jgi:redox-sensitive bicupin YhaK (pirin superfamily)
MNKVIHRAETRGKADFGWLKANYYFSFANYYDPSRIHFGQLRVVNDDHVDGGMGFSPHPHNDMEIITIPQSGSVAHRDSSGGQGVITAGEVQVMSAGSGVTHSEFNGSKTEALKLFQIWIFPHEKGLKPRYDQKKFDEAGRKNNFQLLVSNDGRNESLMIHQDAFLSMIELEKGETKNYKNYLPKNGVFLIVVEGEITIDGEKLKRRDAIGISGVDEFNFETNSTCKLLFIEVPMN